MKKAKIMLLTIAVLATVGGALAFKAKAFGTKDYCYSITNVQPPVGDCTIPKVQGLAHPLVSEEFKAYYTTTTNTLLCEDAICPSIGTTTFEE